MTALRYKYRPAKGKCPPGHRMVRVRKFNDQRTVSIEQAFAQMEAKDPKFVYVGSDARWFVFAVRDNSPA